MPAQITIRYYAAARELAGCEEEAIDLAEAPLSQDAFRALLAGKHPRLAGYLARMRLAVNGDFVEDDATIGDGDGVDILPPVAGGSGVSLVAIKDTPLSMDEVYRAVMHPAAGGVVIFTGVVRDHADGNDVARLDYESHEALAEKELRRVLEGVLADWPEARVAAAHRVGELKVRDLAVVVAASAPHRGEAFEACRAAIDRIKESVPIWKKEWGPDGQAHWVNLEG